jgi:ABC-type multidrug transport system fused ATPase/permease subunit
VQVDARHGHVVDRGFRLREPLEERERAGAAAGRQRRAIDEPGNLLQRVMRVPAVAVRVFVTMRVVMMAVIVRVALIVMVMGLVVMMMVRIPVVVMIATIVFMVMVDVLAVPGRALIEDTELRCRHARAEHALGGHPAVIDGEAAEGLAQRLERQAEVEQRADHHVAGRPGKAIEVQRLRHRQIVPLSR